MATAATATRPMPVGAQDFNVILEEKIVFPDVAGKNQETTYLGAVTRAVDVVKALQERVVGRIAHFKTKEADKTQIASEYREFKDQYDAMEGLALKTQEVLENFKGMVLQYNPQLDKPNAPIKRINNKEDAEGLIKYLTMFLGVIRNSYLTKGTMSSYLPDYLDQLQKMVPAQRV